MSDPARPQAPPDSDAPQPEEHAPASTRSGPAIDARIALTLVALALGFAFASLAGYDPFSGLPTRALEETDDLFFTATGSAPLVIAGGAAFLLFQRRQALLSSLGSPAAPALSAGLLGLGCALALWAHFVAAIDLFLVAFVCCTVGIALALGGRAAARAIALPVGFLLLLVPFPAAWINAVVYPLQTIHASTAAALLSAVGADAVASGDRIEWNGTLFQVIETCSGLRFMDTLFMATILYLDLFFRSSRQVVTLLLLSPVIAFIANQLRVLTIVLNPYSEFAHVHTIQGVAMLVVAILLLAAIDRWIARFDPRQTSESETPPIQASTPMLPTRPTAIRLIAVCGVMIALGCALRVVTPYRVPTEMRPGLFEFPRSFSGWRSQSVAPDRVFLGSVRFDQATSLVLERRSATGVDPEGGSVMLFLGDDDRRERRESPRSPKTRLPGSGWEIVEAGPPGPDLRDAESIGAGPGTSLDSSGIESWIVQFDRSKQLVFHWTIGADDFSTEWIRAAAALDQSPLRRPGRSLVVRLSTPLDDSIGSLHDAHRRLSEAAANVQHELAPFAAPPFIPDR